MSTEWFAYIWKRTVYQRSVRPPPQKWTTTPTAAQSHALQVRHILNYLSIWIGRQCNCRARIGRLFCLFLLLLLKAHSKWRTPNGMPFEHHQEHSYGITTWIYRRNASSIQISSRTINAEWSLIEVLDGVVHFDIFGQFHLVNIAPAGSLLAAAVSRSVRTVYRNCLRAHIRSWNLITIAWLCGEQQMVCLANASMNA